MTKRERLTHWAIAVFVLEVFLLGCTDIHDTDTWMHLAMGREIARQRALPSIEVWTYPVAGQPTANFTWLFSLILYTLWAALGPAGPVLLKAGVLAILFWVLARDSLLPEPSPAPTILILTAVALGAHPRFVERPELAMMLFLAVVIHWLNLLTWKGRWWIAWSAAIALAWGNTHSSVNLVVVPFAAYLAGSIVQRVAAARGLRLPGTLPRRDLAILAVLGAAAVGLGLVNPYWSGTWTTGVAYLRSSWHSHEISELLPPAWPRDPWPFVITPLLVLSLLLSWRRAFLGQLVLVLPFVWLAFTSRRFSALLVVVAGPVIARSLAVAMSGSRWWLVLQRPPAVVAAVLAASSMMALTYFRVEPFGTFTARPGLGVNYSTVPEGALRYLDSRGVTGRLLNQYEWGGYVIWRDFPRRAPFIDGRGGLPPALLEAWQSAGDPRTFDRLDARYGIDAVLLGYPTNTTGADLGRDLCFPHAGWTLVYWDDLSVVYLKKNGKWADVAAKDAYRVVQPCNDIPGVLAASSQPAVRPALVAELERAAHTTGASRAWALLGAALVETGSPARAIEALSHVRRTFKHDFRPTQLSALGNAYVALGRLEDAIRSYEGVFRLAGDATSLYQVALVHRRRGDHQQELLHLARAGALKDAPPSVFRDLAQAYRDAGRGQEAAEAEVRFKELSRATEGERHFNAGLKAYVRGNLFGARAEFARSVEVNPSSGSARGNLGFVLYDLGLLSEAYQQHRLAIEVDPGQANSHYGLALILRRWNDTAGARHHWQEYLRLEPRGFHARRAQEQLDSLEP